MATSRVRPELPRLPKRMARLPVDKRGYPVPWFTAYFEGEPDFRVLDPTKLTKAVRERRCWVCGDKMGAFNYFVISPLCAADRTSTEPPSHEECAEFAARACPFLTRPAMRRRAAGLPEETFEAAGVVIDHSPGVVLVWATLSYDVRRLDNGVDFAIGEPMSCRWYAEGRKATRGDLIAAIESLPAPGLSGEKVAGLLRLFEKSG